MNSNPRSVPELEILAGSRSSRARVRRPSGENTSNDTNSRSAVPPGSESSTWLAGRDMAVPDSPPPGPGS
jgi:hypothetical protein